jgi:hypothetical protein
MIRTSLFPLALALALAGCGKTPEQSAAVAEQTSALEAAAAATGGGGDAPACKLFTPAEIGAYVGLDVGAGTKAAMGSGCLWTGKDGESNAMVQIIPADYAEYPSLDPSFRKLPEISEDAYAAEDLVGWKAGALTGASFVIVSVAGPKASPETVAAFLKDARTRQP